MSRIDMTPKRQRQSPRKAAGNTSADDADHSDQTDEVKTPVRARRPAVEPNDMVDTEDPWYGLHTPAEADVSKTTPGKEDEALFRQAMSKAEVGRRTQLHGSMTGTDLDTIAHYIL